MTTKSLKAVQRLLFVVGADLASDTKPSNIPRVTHEDTLKIERMTDEVLSRLPTLRNFILPGGSRLASEIQYARAVCRRAERRVVAASKSEKLNRELVPFLNRLSSYFFNLARLANARSRVKEEAWKA